MTRIEALKKRTLSVASLALRFALVLACVSLAFADIPGGPVLTGLPTSTTLGSGTDPVYDFTFVSNDLSVTAVGVLDATPCTAGMCAYSGIITVAASGNSQDVGTSPLFANPSAPSASYSPSGYFIYDDTLQPGANPSITNDGLLFITAGGLEINIFSNGPSSPVPNGSYQFYDNAGYNILGNFTLTEVPEASSAVLLSFLLTGLAGFSWRKKA